MHATTEQPAGFDRALEAVANWLIGLFQGSYDALQVAPEVGPYGNLELMATVRRYAEAGAGLAIGQFHVIQGYAILKVAHRQARVIRVVDAKAQKEALLQQLGLDHLDLDQAHDWLLQIPAEPGGAPRETDQQGD